MNKLGWESPLGDVIEEEVARGEEGRRGAREWVGLWHSWIAQGS